MHHSEKKIRVIPGGNQMSLIRDTEEVVKFLEFASRKALLNEHAVTCRLTACHNLFGTLNEEEDNLDYILSNLDVLVHRFRNRNPNVLPNTLKVYKSRVKSSIEDFKGWSSDPFAWERSLTDKARPHHPPKERKVKTKAKGKTKAIPVVTQPAEDVPVSIPETVGGHRKVAFPIRKNFTVEMTLPVEGLSLKELHRLGLFLFPYCPEIDPEKFAISWFGQ